MYMKVFPHGRGNGSAPTRYLVRPDYPGRDAHPPEVLRGDVERTRALIDSLDTTWRFTAGVLSWHPEDTVTPEQEQRVMDDFEAVAFAGLEEDQRAILWVRHSHAGHHELHFVIPRVELSSGRAFNPCPPGWQKDFDVFRDLHNIREGWARPDDPQRARLCTPDHADLHAARLLRWGRKPGRNQREENRQAVHDYVLTLLEQGKIRTREDISAAWEKTISLSMIRRAATSSASREVSMQNSASSLAEKLRARTEKERQATEALFQENFHALQQHLQASSKSALATTENAILESLAQLEQDISSRCRTMGTVFSRPCRLALLWSCAILIVSVLTIWGLLMLSQYRIEALEQEISNLSARREQLEAQNASLWNSFKGLEPYQAEGKSYLLTPAGQQIVNAGKVGQRDAWEVVRR